MGTCTDVESLLRLAHSLDHLEDYAESEDLYRQVSKPNPPAISNEPPRDGIWLIQKGSATMRRGSFPPPMHASSKP
jgi:hypothetical protein